MDVMQEPSGGTEDSPDETTTNASETRMPEKSPAMRLAVGNSAFIRQCGGYRRREWLIFLLLSSVSSAANERFSAPRSREFLWLNANTGGATIDRMQSRSTMLLLREGWVRMYIRPEATSLDEEEADASFRSVVRVTYPKFASNELTRVPRR